MRRSQALAVFLILMCAGCARSIDPDQPIARSLPPKASVVQAPASIPTVSRGDDATEKLAEALASAAENARRLKDAGANYDALRRRYGAGNE